MIDIYSTCQREELNGYDFLMISYTQDSVWSLIGSIRTYLIEASIFINPSHSWRTSTNP